MLGGAEDMRGFDERNMASGLRKPSVTLLSPEEISFIKKEIAAIGADESIFLFNRYGNTGYLDELGYIRVGRNVFPDFDSESTHPTDLMSERAVLAHEYYGHYMHRQTKLAKGSWNDEFRASYDAARYSPGLSDADRRFLVMDAMDRARAAGVSIKPNVFMKEVLYGEDYKRRSFDS